MLEPFIKIQQPFGLALPEGIQSYLIGLEDEVGIDISGLRQRANLSGSTLL
ncbi:hypothetical protein SAMN05192543_1075 [Paraburkholderia megapolitana]|uniref:Uncharacterized protein n=1 Tax=Paraburkholderia megapolitana TaxID=420953 RepID=A0A1I3R3Z6_9BURK|nr:hypothetical protein SAMN05192543_1075 [Paraburkholderia megapolitana]